jgi:chromosome segregation ATPase
LRAQVAELENNASNAAKAHARERKRSAKREDDLRRELTKSRSEYEAKCTELADETLALRDYHTETTLALREQLNAQTARVHALEAELGGEQNRHTLDQGQNMAAITALKAEGQALRAQVETQREQLSKAAAKEEEQDDRLLAMRTRGTHQKEAIQEHKAMLKSLQDDIFLGKIQLQQKNQSLLRLQRAAALLTKQKGTSESNVSATHAVLKYVMFGAYAKLWKAKRSMVQTHGHVVKLADMLTQLEGAHSPRHAGHSQIDHHPDHSGKDAKEVAALSLFL